MGGFLESGSLTYLPSMSTNKFPPLVHLLFSSMSKSIKVKCVKGGWNGGGDLFVEKKELTSDPTGMQLLISLKLCECRHDRFIMFQQLVFSRGQRMSTR